MRARRIWKSKSVRKPRAQKLLKDGHVPEKVIQKQILVWLESTGLLFWRQNAGKIGYYTMGPNGISDIVVIMPPNGRFLGLEVKSATGRLRPAQKLFRDRLEASGGVYRVVRTLVEAQNVIAEVLGEESWKAKRTLSTQANIRDRVSSVLD